MELLVLTSGKFGMKRSFGENFPEDKFSSLSAWFHVVRQAGFAELDPRFHFWTLKSLRAMVAEAELKSAPLKGLIRRIVDDIAKLIDDNAAIIAFTFSTAMSASSLADLKIICSHLRAGWKYRECVEAFRLSDAKLTTLGYRGKTFTDLGFEYQAGIPTGKCRFCLKNEAAGATFFKKPHAISYFLGNHNLLGVDECDKCNEYFGEKLEQYLYRYYQPTNMTNGILGRGKNPEFIGANFEQSLDRTVIDADDLTPEQIE